MEANLDLSEEEDEAAEEIIHDLSDEEDEAVELLSTLAPPQQEWPAERGSLLRSLSQAETVAATAIQADPDKFGRATEARSLFGREHYSVRLLPLREFLPLVPRGSRSGPLHNEHF